MKLAYLKKVDLRECWPHEALDFTNWLAEEDNLNMLSTEIGMDINLLETESKIGNFNVDILAENESGQKVVIENQLEPTDHDHLGKIITYASGCDASTIIWVVKNARDEHKQAVDWLNTHTDQDINFFIVKIELWQIDSSIPAAKFNVISSPNDWAKTVKRSINKQELTDTKIMQLEFWERFNDYIDQDANSCIRIRKAHPQHWYNISAGISESHVSLVMNTQANRFECQLYIPDNKDMFLGLIKYRSEIHDEIGKELEWMELPDKKASRIKATYDVKYNVADKEYWQESFKWLKVSAESFLQIFPKYIMGTRKKLN